MITSKFLNNINTRQIKLLISLFLIVSIFVCYWKVQYADFISFDDNLYVTENRFVQAGLTRQGVIWALTTTDVANWHPLTWLSHMLDCELYGMNPMGHHQTSLLFHVANSLLLFCIFQQMTGAVWPSAFVAALFALHPLHVESVAWISERKGVLSTFFGFLSMAFYIRYVRKKRFSAYLMSILFLCLGLMAKPMLVTLPFVLLLLDFWPLGRFSGEQNSSYKIGSKVGMDGRQVLRLILEKVPFFVFISGSCIVTFITQRSGGAVRSLEAFPLDVRITNAFVSYVKYIGKTLWPRKLAVYYPHPGYALPVWQIFGAILFIVVAFVFTVRTFRKYPYVIVGLLWYFGTLAPVIGFIQVGSQAMADRYTYIPLIGLFILIAWGIPNMLINRPYQGTVLAVFAALILLGLSVSTFVQVGYWKNSGRLFKNAIKTTAKNWKAHNHLGVAFFKQGKVDEAIYHYRTALSIRPGDVLAHSNLGVALVKKGNLAEAASHYKTALRINPEFALAHYNFGSLLLKQNRFKEAMGHFSEAIRINPEYAKAYYAIGWILYSWGKHQGARYFFAKVLQIDSGFVEARKNLENLDRVLNKTDRIPN